MDTSILFSNIESLLKISEDFSTELKKILEKGPKGGIKEPFMLLLVNINAYKAYFSNWNNVNDLLNSNTKSSLSVFLKQREVRCQQGLLNLLSLPVTRLPQYEIVLHDILGTLPSIHTDYNFLKDAYQNLKSFVQELDSIRCRSENDAHILKIMRRMARFDGSLLEEGRRFVLEDEVHCVINKKKHEGLLTLFSDMLLFARYLHYSNKLKYKCHVPLTYATLIPDPETEEKNAIKLIVKVLPESGNAIEHDCVFLIAFPSVEMKDKWIAQVKQVLHSVATKKVFGVSIMRTNVEPTFLRKLLSYLSTTEFNTGDMQLVNANELYAKKIKQDADSGKEIEFSSPLVAASVLKLYVRELPETIITSELRCWFLELAGPEANAGQSELNRLYRAILSQLPSANRDTLKEIINCFHQIVNRNASKIDPYSFGKVYGASIFYGKGDVDPSELQWSINATEYMVKNYGDLFGT